MRCATDLIQLFEHCFFAEFNTRLQGGADEPFYQPATANEPALVIFTRDYFASALHEVAHWCVAGDTRRALPDYGYWYAPDGRSAAQQLAFEKVEVKPQALEWIFSVACGFPFRVSADNLAAGMGASEDFKAEIVAQARVYCQSLALRPARFVAALSEFYRVDEALQPSRYQQSALA